MPNRRAKTLISVVLLLALIAVGTATAGVWYYLGKSGQVKNDLAEFVLANPETAAVVAYTFDDRGEPVDDEYALFHNADEPLVMASTMKIIVLFPTKIPKGNGNMSVMKHSA